jgi:hypothetical protein
MLYFVHAEETYLGASFASPAAASASGAARSSAFASFVSAFVHRHCTISTSLSVLPLEGNIRIFFVLYL